MKGAGDLLPIAIILLLALALGDVANELGTGVYVANVVSGNIPSVLAGATGISGVRFYRLLGRFKLGYVRHHDTDRHTHRSDARSSRTAHAGRGNLRCDFR